MDKPRISRAASHALAVAIGFAAFAVLFGPRFVLGEAPYLQHPVGDIAVELSAYYRMAQDAWRFPLFSLPLANEPEGSNQLFSGGVPLLSLVAKILRSLTGETVNLFGAWYLLCVVLQAHAMYFLITQISDRRPLLAALGAISGVLAHAFVTRFGHVSLFAQFFVIYAMGLVIATTRDDARPPHILGWLGALCAISLYVFAYIAITNVILFCTAVVSLLWLRRITVVDAALSGAALAAGMLALAWIGGYFWGIGRAAPVDVSAFAVLGLNLGSLVIPHKSLIYPTSPPISGWWEGDFYLGAGIIVLWVALVVIAPGLVAAPIKRHWPLAALLFALAVFCLSNHVRYGPHTLLHYTTPEFMHPVIGQLRAGGRLFWPLGYLLIAAPVALVIQHSPAYATRIVVALGIVALLDVTGSRQFLRDTIITTANLPLSHETLRRMIAGHKAVRVYPSFWCDPDLVSPSRHAFHQAIELEMGRANVRSNSVITARKIKDCTKEQAPESIPPDELVFLLNAASQSRLSATDRQLCRPVRSQALACSTRHLEATP